MSDTTKNSDNSLYEQQERKLMGQSEAFLSMLTRRGLLEDPQIGDDKVRQAVKTKKRNMYHNTQLMLRHYRDINWALECFPSHIAEELDRPLGDLDALLSLIDAELGMDNAKLEGRMKSVQKSRLLLDRFNEALTVLRQKPVNGELMYQSLYLTYITTESLDVASSVLRNLEELQSIGQRAKFPAKSSCSQGRWCSGTLKAEVQSGVTTNLEQTRSDTKVLIVSGERRGESAGRARYNEMEIHRTNATQKAHRLVHQWRAVIDYSIRDIWEMLKRHKINPHPCYACGWNRCSCMCCIFSLPTHWAGIRELFPDIYEAFRQDELQLGFTLDNKKFLYEYGKLLCDDSHQLFLREG